MDRQTVADIIRGMGSTHLVDALCPSVEAFDKFEEVLRENLWNLGQHERQVDLTVQRSRELMTEGQPCSMALALAAVEAGKPARKKDIVWDDELRELISRFPS
jgi:hypothetical protein